MKTAFLRLVGALSLACAVAGCSDSSAPAGGAAQISFNVATASTGSAAALTAPADSIVLGADVLVLTKVEMVLRDIKFRRQNHDACDSVASGHDDDSCEEFSAGPVLVDFPLNGGAEEQFTVTADTGVFGGIELKLHKPEDDGDAADQAFLALHPDFSKISIRVTGTFNGNAFTYTSDLNAEQEFDINPPLVVNQQSDVAVTLKVDVSSWFRNGSVLIDPSQALKDGAFENQVKNNIEASFEAFHDDNHDGQSDDD
ncbi:MAG: hypothetical protein ABI679_14195 [Gemmatimonadota bacterium]